MFGCTICVPYGESLMNFVEVITNGLSLNVCKFFSPSSGMFQSLPFMVSGFIRK